MTIVEGIKTNIPLHIKLLEDPDFLRGEIDTNFMMRYDPRERSRSTMFAEPAGVTRFL